MIALRAGMLAAALVLLAACGGGDEPAAGGDPSTDDATTETTDASAASGQDVGGDVPVVVVTMNVLADIVDTAIGDLVEVVDVMPRGVDPHAFELSASAAEQLNDADLIVVNGLNMEENVLPIVEAAAADGVEVLEIAPLVDPIPYGDIGLDDDVTMLDPHVFTDVRRMVVVPELVAQRLTEVVEFDAETLTLLDERVAAAREQLEQLDRDVEEILEVVPPERRNLVTNHHVFGYFAERYDFTLIGAVIPGGATLASPSAADLADLVEAIERAGVPTLFADASSPAQLVDALANEASIDVEVVSLWTESLSPEGEGAETYEQMMRDNARRIADGLSR